MKDRKNTKNTKILFIGCNYDQLPYLAELKAREYFIVGIDKNPNAPGRNLCNFFYEIGYDEFGAMIEVGETHFFGAKDKVFTAASQFAHKGAASFAAHFGCSYPKVNDVDACLNKVAYYTLFPEIGVPIPLTTFVESQHDLEIALKRFDPDSFCYLKSDFSKSPNYVYRFRVSDFHEQSIFWGRDRYLRECYILQEEFIGQSLRINLYGDRFNVYDFKTGLKAVPFKSEIDSFGIIGALKKIRSHYGMDRWLLKFDVILNKDQFVVLDIGMDPPFRMNNTSVEQGVNFASHYLNHYLDDFISYPHSLD